MTQSQAEPDPPAAQADRSGSQQRILDAVLGLLAEQGIAGVSMRAVAREAGVALGLVNHHYGTKTALVVAALRHIENQDLALVEADPDLAPEPRLRAALRRIAAPQYLTTPYLSLRLQLWALAQADPAYAAVNATAQQGYHNRLIELIRRARPDLRDDEATARATDIDIIQNGIWLTALLGLDPDSIARAVHHCEVIALD